MDLHILSAFSYLPFISIFILTYIYYTILYTFMYSLISCAIFPLTSASLQFLRIPTKKLPKHRMAVAPCCTPKLTTARPLGIPNGSLLPLVSSPGLEVEDEKMALRRPRTCIFSTIRLSHGWRLQGPGEGMVNQYNLIQEYIYNMYVIYIYNIRRKFRSQTSDNMDR